jgi:hypothetical protein
MAGGSVLNTIFKHAKLIALLTCVVLFSSVIDNIPDCPELLNQTNAKASSIQSTGHFNPAAVSSSPYVKHIALVQLPAGSQLVVCVLVPFPFSCITQSLYQVTDPSPPRA